LAGGLIFLFSSSFYHYQTRVKGHFTLDKEHSTNILSAKSCLPSMTLPTVEKHSAKKKAIGKLKITKKQKQQNIF
jgi:hypothetical protein